MKKKKNIVLIGMPGAGKSTIGVILAKVLGKDFIDADLVIQKEEGRLLSEIIEQEGPDGFLSIEERVNASLEPEGAIISTGGSVVYGEKAMEHLGRIGVIVYLKLSCKAVESRLRDIRGRGVVLRDGQTLSDVSLVSHADKTVLKMMGEMGLRCGIRRETDYHKYNSYRGRVGETFENVLGRDFKADGPWQKMGTDVTEFKCSFGKAYLAPVYDFGSKEIVAHSISPHPDLAQQEEMLAMLVAAKPEGAEPVLHSDMGWQYQHASYVEKLRENGFIQSMSRKGNCIDNGATEQVFGHIKDEFFRGRDWDDFESFKRDLEEYIVHWNTRRRQVKLKGLTPVEFREQALREAA